MIPGPVVGIDPSLTAAGIAVIKHPDIAPTPNAPIVRVVGESGIRDATVEQRARRIRAQLQRVLGAIPGRPLPALVVVEALPRAIPNEAAASMYLERGALFWWLIDALTRRGVPVAEVGVTTLKLWATGSGKATKADVHDAMLAMWPTCADQLRGPRGGINDNASDSLGLASIGAQKLGWFPPEVPYQFAPRVSWPAGLSVAQSAEIAPAVFSRHPDPDRTAAATGARRNGDRNA